MGSSPIIPTIFDTTANMRIQMIWTIIYKDSKTNDLRTEVMQGPFGQQVALNLLSNSFGGDVLAIVAGSQTVYFNNRSKQSLCDDTY